ncbi:NAD(P)/FAD-dependent oxidoreductase [Brucella pseudogrignonensis]|uniref:NAD(P)/FAD-dependent oxidoreductase n=1 Tax=Brucella pseudogrignonensis TaxID=419475 RepID=UPI000CFC52FE|nr:FAD-binding oxidoreductase [Brucella pseudogrignonensis]MQP40782.1 FAD-dependent oxidoreductase [Ochrobactrum sp. MYb237]PQZ40743.1 D-amino-acid oxidase [Brucella pseudogrignonensis]PRA40537.1 D-amino-acid oxidase [Brucella pseudogrignonensis]PRA69133.1 D-amino-acid oxidase [Brucella pseudogrignonensis]
MGPITDKVATAERLPQETKVAIIGGGVIGVSTALFLAERGIPVALFEKGEIAGEQSSRNWGWCRRTGRDSREMPLIVESMRLWDSMNERVGRETGFRVTGIAYTAEKEEEVERYAEWIKIASEHGIETQLLNGQQAASLAPGLTRPLKGGMITPLDGRAEPQKAVPAFAAKAQELGAVILQNCAVRGIETTNGRVSAVLTEKGRVACEAIVVAGGAWSRLIISSFDAHLPQLKVRSSVFRTSPIESGVEPAIAFSDFALRKRLDGGYTVASLGGSIADIVPDSFRFFRDFLPSLSTEWKSLRFRFGERFFEEAFQWKLRPADQVSVFEKIRTLDPEPHRAANAAVLAKLKAAIPSFASATIAQEWAGLIDTMPDVIPVISPLPGIDGLIVATGFSGHGFGIGPGAGRLVADMVSGETPVVDPSPFHISRFSDGSKIRIENWG